MTQKERLVDLLENAPGHSNVRYKSYKEAMEDLADYLLANGVIVPPCKVGDAVYKIRPYYNEIEKNVITGVVYESNEFEFWFETDKDGDDAFDSASLGKLYFLTKQEAEQALKERDDVG